jgi:hypothetical protein
VDVLDPALTRPGPVRSADLRPAARREGPAGHPQGPQPQVEARAERGSCCGWLARRPDSAAPTSPRSSTKPPWARRWRTRNTSSRTTSRRRATRSAGAGRERAA